jgi:hypothetical protein
MGAVVLMDRVNLDTGAASRDDMADIRVRRWVLGFGARRSLKLCSCFWEETLAFEIWALQGLDSVQKKKRE